jgi:hypothetical protein
MYSHLESVICDMFYIHPYGEMMGSRNENKCERECECKEETPSSGIVFV